MDKPNFGRDLLVSAYTTMYQIRIFEEQSIKLYRQGHIRGYFHPYWGEEAIATGVCRALSDGDYITSTHRGHGHCLAWGADPGRMFAELLGKKTGYCKGLGGSMHIADYSRGNLGANGVVGSGVPIAVGAALGATIKGESRVVASFVSDGASNIGSFLEGLNLAAVWKLPVIFIIENNQFAVSTPIEESTAESQLYKRGMAFGIESIRIDGNDIKEVYETARGFAGRARNGEGPFLMECMTFRKSGHHVNDPGQYLPKDKIEHYEKHDPLLICKKYLAEAGITDNEVTQLEENVLTEIKNAIQTALHSEEMTKSEFLNFVNEYSL